MGVVRARARVALVAISMATASWFAAAPAALAVTPTPPTAAQVADAIKGGQQYLFNQFRDNGDGTGYWNDYDALTGTSAAVVALVESGKMSDPLYRAMIDKGIAYIKSRARPNGGIYESAEAYQTGMALVALGLYGQATTTDAAYRTLVQNAVDFLKSYQNIEGSQRGGDYSPTGAATTTNPTACGSGYGLYYGGWGYYPGDNNTNKCVGGADLSNTQFVVMGLWYGSRYLGEAVDTAPWAKALLFFLKSQQGAHGGFTVYAGGDYPQRTGTASALWSLAMIGQTAAKKAPEDTNTMVQNAINWFATGTDAYDWAHPAAYTWNNEQSAYLYFIYAMSKALTATIGPAGKVGTNDWALDMEAEIVYSAYRTTVAADGTNPAYDVWNSQGGLDPRAVGQTSWVLMSLAFASTSTESTEKLLAQEDRLDNLVKGLITLHTTDGVTISAATRGNVAEANLGQNVALPIGSMSFSLNNVPVGGTAVLSIQPPFGALDPANPNGFLNADSTIKSGLSWFKIVAGEWKGQAAVPITIDTARGVILVTLKDGGPEDADGVANGRIVDPGAPGFGFVAPAAPVAAADDDGLFGCSIGNGRPDPTLALLLAGAAVYLVRRRRRV